MKWRRILKIQNIDKKTKLRVVGALLETLLVVPNLLLLRQTKNYEAIKSNFPFLYTDQQPLKEAKHNSSYQVMLFCSKKTGIKLVIG